MFYLYIQSDFADDQGVQQLLECEFHSADYHTILDVITGLKTAVALLEKVMRSYVSQCLVVVITFCKLVAP